uniref:Autotransporter beta-domain protein n=1 Tax=uncultured bacterium A1Q1_fos_517 TaxID=1256582 RepID=L7VRE1_9BACT|nr:autotransporter beta-domain protein [uncultured bacterium A1Q1_fos_517]
MKRSTKLLAACSGLCGLAALAWPTVSSASSFRGLIGSPGAAPERVEAYSISDDGRVVVGQLRTAGMVRGEAFRWTAEAGFERLGILGGEDPESAALAVSADGSVVVGWTTSPLSNYGEAFRWERSTGMIGLGDLPGGYAESSATAVSADGSVVVGRSTSALAPNSFGEAFRWTAATGMVGLGVMTSSGFDYSFADGVSADGTSITGTASTEQGHEIFLWTALDGMVPLGSLEGKPYPTSYGLDISADGTALIGFTDYGSQVARSFRWTAAGGMEELGDLPGSGGNRVFSLSADGSVAVGDAFLDGRTATIWDATHGMRELKQALIDSGLAQEIEGWTLEYGAGVAGDNLTIAGSGINPAGEHDAFIAELGPPSIVQIPTVSGGMLVAFAMLLAAGALGRLRILRRG